MNNYNILETDFNDPIVITGQSVLSPTGITNKEVFDNQIAGLPNHQIVTPYDYSVIQSLEKNLKGNKDHPILKTGMLESEAKKAIEEIISLGGGLPSQIRGAVSLNGKQLNDKDLIKLIKDTLENTELNEEYKKTVGGSVGKGKFDPSILHSIYMSLMATKDAGLLGDDGIIDSNASVNLGCGFAGLRNVENGAIGGLIIGTKSIMGAKHLVGTLPNMPAPIVANVLKAQAGSTIDDEACAAAGYAYQRAVLQIINGQTNIAIAGGCDAVSDSIYALSSFGRMGALVKGYKQNTDLASRPFTNPIDEHEKGFVLGDGGGISVLERQSNAERRGAKPLAQISGIGSSTCNPMHIDKIGLSTGTVKGQSLSMENALKSACITPELFIKEGGVIFAHGTSTRTGDKVEANSIHNVFGSDVNISGVKGVIGHSLGGSAAQSVAIGVSAMQNKIIPGTLNYTDDNTMEGIPELNILQENKKGDVKWVLINAFGFGGHNISLLLENPNV